MTIFLIIVAAAVLLFVFKSKKSSRQVAPAPSEPTKKPQEPVVDLSDRPLPLDQNGTK